MSYKVIASLAAAALLCTTFLASEADARGGARGGGARAGGAHMGAARGGAYRGAAVPVAVPIAARLSGAAPFIAAGPYIAAGIVRATVWAQRLPALPSAQRLRRHTITTTSADIILIHPAIKSD